MKKNTLVTWLAVAAIPVIAILLIVFGSRETDVEETLAPGGGMISLESSFWDFGSISMAQGIVTHEFKVENNTGAPAVISRISTSCMCTTASLLIGDRSFGPYGMPGHGYSRALNQTLHPGESAILSIAFDPAAHGPAGVGPVERTVFLETDSGEAVTVEFKAMVKP